MAALMNNIVTAAPKELPDLYSGDLRDLVVDILQKLPEMRPTVTQILERAIIRAVAETLPAWPLYQARCDQDLTMPKSDRAREAPEVVEEGIPRKDEIRRRPPVSTDRTGKQRLLRKPVFWAEVRGV